MNYLIDFIDSLTLPEIEEYAAANGLTIIKQYAGFGNVFLMSADSEPTVNDMIESVVLDEGNTIQLLNIDVTFTDNSVPTEFNTNNDQNWWKVASLDTLDYDNDVITHARRGQDSTVYIMDSGIKQDHPEFADADITLLHSVTGEFDDLKGHGTALASVISGKTCGLTNAKIKVVKLFNDNSQTLQSEILEAFNAVIADYQINGGPSVVNCSWGIAYNEYINNKIQILIDMGVYVVAAAGNSGIPISNVTPASMPDVVTVGAFGQTLEPSDFSNYTDSSISLTQNETNSGELDGWAPGEMIYAANKNGDYSYAGGTSCAAAISSGALAYNMSRYVDSTHNKNYEPITNFNTRKAKVNEMQAEKIQDEVPVTFTPFKTVIFNREGLLDLTDPKYVGSKNLVTTYVTKSKNYAPLFRSLYVVAGTPFEGMAFDRYKMERIVSIGDTPEWLSVDERGMIEIDNLTLDEGTLYNEFDPVEFTVTFRDGSVGYSTLVIIGTAQKIDKTNVEEILPPGDPLIESVLYAGCNPGTCTDDCTLPQVCDVISKSACFCNL